jgi:hypothetical protein
MIRRLEFLAGLGGSVAWLLCRVMKIFSGEIEPELA